MAHTTTVMVLVHDLHLDYVPACDCGWSAAPWCYYATSADVAEIHRHVNAELELHEDLYRDA